MLDQNELDGLAGFDTPTICNAIEVLAPERRGWGYTVSPFFVLDRSAPPMVGYARTATIRASQPTGRSPEADRASRIAYYKHIDEGDEPTITVIEDIDAHVGFGAWWGEVHSNVHKGLGSLGVITNGSIRDVDDWADGFQALAGSLSPSHAWVHEVEYAIPVTVHGMAVSPGDLIHADVHGAVVVPDAIARDIPEVLADLIEKESTLITASQAEGFSAEVYERLINSFGPH
ncbi:MAG: RraA family protein [Actinomycetia bacterium]|nr:RraA family protein [Actinomycetes bacterium]MCP4963062.1 RraA family protein [Actinomycetes bacterium]